MLFLVMGPCGMKITHLSKVFTMTYQVKTALISKKVFMSCQANLSLFQRTLTQILIEYTFTILVVFYRAV